MANYLDYFYLLFKPEISSDIRDHMTHYAIIKTYRNSPDYVVSVWQEATVEEL